MLSDYERGRSAGRNGGRAASQALQNRAGTSGISIGKDLEQALRIIPQRSL